MFGAFERCVNVHMLDAIGLILFRRPNMSTEDCILVIDEGTTSTRAIIFNRDFEPVATAQKDIGLAYANDGWVEQDGAEIWEATREVCRFAIAEIGGPERLAGIGITNQRETTLVWDRASGKPVSPAIVWQDRRTSEYCAQLRDSNLEPYVQKETGLLLDPYFSGTKLKWILDTVPGARERAAGGELAFGTVDSWLIWNLTGASVHATDVTNASRTLLYPLSIEPDADWSEYMLGLLDIPKAILPDVRPSSSKFGSSPEHLFGKDLPVVSAAGDQQAALVGQGGIQPWTAKITYGTGAFLVANTGADQPVSVNRLLGTIAYSTETGDRAFALEGSIFNAGTVVQWLRDDLSLIRSASESETLAGHLEDNGGVYLVPAFSGLGAPHWDANARGLFCGLTRATGVEHLVRAGLESTAFQTHDLLEAFKADGAEITRLRVDGGMATNNWLMQFIADICQIPVERANYSEMTALGAAVLAGVQLGWITLDEWSQRGTIGQQFYPKMEEEDRQDLLQGWQGAVARTLSMTGSTSI